MKLKLKVFFAKVKLTILSILAKAEDLIEKIAPVAINFVDAVKSINESAVGDFIELVVTKAISGNADDIVIRNLREKLKESLPDILEEMRLVLRLSQIEDNNLQLKAIIDAIQMSPDKTKDYYYHTFAIIVTERISDGHLSMSDSVFIAEQYFKLIHNK